MDPESAPAAAAAAPVVSERRSKRVPKAKEMPTRLKSLFHDSGLGKSKLKSKLQRIHESPNVYFVNDFLNANELAYFDKVCSNQEFTRSFTENEENEHVVSTERTSNYIHLEKSQDRVVRAIEQRAADLVGLHGQCVEPLQIVSYTNGQKFDLHHDAGTILGNDDDDGEEDDEEDNDEDKDGDGDGEEEKHGEKKEAAESSQKQPEGLNIELVLPRRLITLFIYLNDLPEGQGHTEFPLINISVQPKKGCGVLFCNVKPDGSPDPLVAHKANEVAQGLFKYGGECFYLIPMWAI